MSKKALHYLTVAMLPIAMVTKSMRRQNSILKFTGICESIVSNGKNFGISRVEYILEKIVSFHEK